MTTPVRSSYAKFRAEQNRRRSSPDFAGSTSSPSTTSRSGPAASSRTADGVLVAAPTGSGKTIVGEFAVHLALEQGRKCFYTTPIKALSNQKFNDLVKPLRPRARSASSPATTPSTARHPWS